MGGNLEVDSFSLDELDGFAAKEAGDQVLLDFGRRGDDSREGRGRVGADRDGDLHAAFANLGHRVGRDGGGVDSGSGAAGGARHEVDRRRPHQLCRLAIRKRSRSCSAAFFCRCQCIPVVCLS